jgi:chemotaxis protein MotB
MAFFLLMWLINTTTPEQKRGIADYFAPESVSRSESGNGGLLGGAASSRDDNAGQGALAVTTQPRSRAGEETPKAQSDAETRNDAQSAALARAAARLRQAMQDKPELAELSKHVLIDDTPRGLRVQLVDQDARSMFEAGRAEPKPYAQALLKEVAKIVSGLPYRVAIAGHTDGDAAKTTGAYSNWDLSAARANASLKVLLDSGLGQDHIAEVAGKAGSDPLYPDNPYASANRRISIVLLREAPVLPPGD